MKKVSIILPTYNNERTIEKCLKSLINQTYKNKEIIVIDDGSTDKTLEKIKQFEDNDIKVFSLGHKGRAEAKNFGIEKSKGEILFFGEGDAYYSDNYIEACIKKLEKNKNLVSTVGQLFVWNKNNWITRTTNAERVYAFYTRKPRGGWFFFREYLEKIGKIKNIEFGEDVEFANRLRKYGDIEWCKGAKWYHQEPDSLKELFKKNYQIGKNLIKFLKTNTEGAFQTFVKNFYLPLLLILLILSFFYPILWVTLLLSIPLVIRYFRFVYITHKKNLKLSESLPAILLWIVKSVARVLGILRSLF